MTTVTQWFNIDTDGQPKHVGWWQVRYLVRCNPEGKMWWDGKAWRWAPDGGPAAFGNFDTRGEYWRGLAVKPKSGISSPTYRPNEKDVVGEGK